MAVWKTLFKEFPNNTEVVWIRVINIYGELTLAEFNEANQTFTVSQTGLIIPASQVARWKSQ